MAKAKKIGKVDRTYAEQSVYGRTISSSKLPVKLQLEDGKYLGDVSYDAYKAIVDGNLDNYKHKNNEEKAIIDKFKAYTQEQYGNQAFTQNEDWTINSTYKSTKNGKKKHLIPGTTFYDETGYDDIEHDYINGDEEAIGIVNTNEAFSGKFILGTDSQFLKTMTPDEIATYNYLYNVEGKEAGKKYLKDISGDLNLRQRLKSETELAKYAKDNKWGTSAATVILAPMKVVSAAGQINDYLDDGQIDQNAGYNKYVYNTNAVRKSVSEEIEKGWSGKVGSFAYNTGMSIGDSMMNTVASGGNKALSLGMMGMGAFANTVVSSKDRGLSDNQAIGLGIVSAGAEIFTENFSWNKLWGAKNVGKSIGKDAITSTRKYIIDNITTNALEEMGADVINFAADVIIAKDKSEWQNSINEYIKAGNSESKAWALAFRDTATQIALSGLAGALSGATMSAPTSLFINSSIKAIGKENSNDVLGIIGDGLSYDKNSEAYKNALKLSKSKSEITDYDLGRQVLLNDVQKITTTIAEGLACDKNSEAYKNALKLKNSQNEITSEDLEHQIALNNAQKNGTSTTTNVANTQPETISVGDVFKDSKSGNTVTVVDRDAETTTVQVNTSKGVTTQKMTSSKADSFVTSGQLVKIESPAETDIAKNATTTTETDAPENIKTINLKRVGDFYEVYGADAILLADEFDGVETQRTVVNGVETDVLRLPANLAEGYADAVSDEYNLVLSDKPKLEKQAVANETVTTDETTPTTEESATESEISIVANAMNDTFKPDAKEQFNNSDLKGDVVKLAELVSGFYKQHGTLGPFANYFTDGGAQVISAITGETNTVNVADTSNDIISVLGETLTPEAKANLQDGDVNENYNSMAESLVEVYKESGTIEDFANFFTDGGKKVEATLQRNIDNAVGDKNATVEQAEISEPKVLKNESESDTIESATENDSVEGKEDGNESVRESVLSGDGRRRHNESTRKQIGRVSYFEQRNQGRDATERQNFARELIERGQVEEVVDGKDKYTLVNPEAYNDDMLAMVEEAKEHGIELGFFVGSATINYDTKDEFTSRGIRVSPTRIVVQYDNVKSPQKIVKHEIVHAKWNTEAIKRIRTNILKALSSQDTKDIFAQKRYARYKRIYKNDNLVLEEFVCDVMSGANEYYERFADTVHDYWYGNEELDSYNVAEYSESIDAGGKEASDGRYDLDGEQNKDISDVKGDVKNGIDESGKISKNGKRSDQIQANSKARSLSKGRVGVYNQQSTKASFNERRSGTVEKTNLNDIYNNKKFSKISRFVVENLTHKLQGEIYADYVNDSRLDIYDFSEIITYDMLSDETNKLRNLFPDEISEYFNGEKLSTNQDVTGEYVSDEILEKTEGTVIVNENGHLIPIYHATPADYAEFEPGDVGIHMGSFSQAIARAQAVVETSNESKDMYMIKGYGALRNPIKATSGDYNWTARECVQVLNDAGALSHEKMMYFWRKALKDNKSATIELRNYLTKQGYDGIVYENNVESVSGTSYILFDNSQIIQLGKEKFNVDDYNYNSDVNDSTRYDIDDADNLGYHAGDLGKSESLGQQGRYRDTGHFGTGTYFVGNKELVRDYNKRDGVPAPQHAVDFSDYNLYKVKNDKDGYALHRQLQLIDGGITEEWVDAAKNDKFSLYRSTEYYYIAEEKFGEEGKYTDEALIYGLTELAKKAGIEIPTREQYSKESGYELDEAYFDSMYKDRLKEVVDEKLEEINDAYAEFRDAYSALEMRFGFKGQVYEAMNKVLEYQKANRRDTMDAYKKDSLATVFMKSLGYEGVDTRGTVLDNTAYGSVIYDLRDDTVRYDLDDADTEYLELAKNPEKNEARLREMVDDAAKSSGYNVRAYHGTSRADRVGNVFLPERATSGPMAFFTDNKDIAEGYSKSKIDTSMAYDPDFDSYETQFRIKTKSGDSPLYRAWGYLPFDARNRITKKAQQLREDWDGDNEFILDPDNKEANGGFQWQLKEARGNTLLALNEQWLNSGTLFNEENRFLEVLEMTGVMEEFKKIGLDSIYFKDPKARHEKVYDTYLRITNPFDTSLIDNSFVDELTSWYEEQDESKYNKESMESDLWDKNSIDAYEFADRVRSDIEKGTFHAWTSIPDSVTDYLKSLGYDGIKDLGGKNSDVGHTVWIPFSSEQIKSADPVTYDDKGNVIPLSERFNTDNKDIRYDLDEDSDGNSLTEEQIEFFKDSQARDKDGKLKVLYHGSPNEFDVFDKNKSGKRGTFVSAKLGFYFTDDITYAKMMGNTSDKKANVFKAYLNIKNPLRVLTTELFDEEGVAEIEKQLKGGNYDGIIDELGNYVVFESNQIKLTDNTNPTDSDNIRYDISEPDTLKTQQKIEKMAKEITSHEEFIELTKQNTKEFVDKIKENKSLQKRLHNAKRQMLLSPNPTVNPTKAGKVTKDILNEMESTLKAKDLQDRVMGIYNEYFAEMKKAKGVEPKVQEANDNMMKQFADLAVDIADSSVAYVESEYYAAMKSYLKEVRIKIPDYAKGEAHYAEFRKAHMGTFNLTNDGLEIDRVYQEMLGMFPGALSEDATNPADQLNEIADALERSKPYAYNPHSGYMQDAIDHIVYRFVSEADGIAVMPKTKAQKIAEKGAYDKEMALEKERAEFERKLDRHKENSEKTIQGLQKKIDDAKYVRYWEKRLSKEEKAQAVKDVRDRRDIAHLKAQIRNIVADMKKKLDKTEKNGGYPKELVQAAAEVCSVIDFQTGRTNKDGTPTKASLKLAELKMQYDALKDNENYDFASEYRQDLSDKIAELYKSVGDKRVVDLTKTELSELKDILSEISHSLSIASKQIGQADAKANAELALEIIESLEAKNDLNDMNKRLFLREKKIESHSIKATILNPHRINEMIAGYDHNNVWWKLHDAINRGNRKTAKFVMEANRPFDELTDGGGNEIAFYDFRTKKIKTGIKYTDGSEVEIPKSIICEMLMMWNRKDGKTHLETGGAKIPDVELYNKGKTVDSIKGGKRTNPITANDIARLKGLLDSYDLAWMDRAHQLFNKVSKDAINETSMQLVGRELARTENYIRMYVDQNFIGKEVGKDQDNNITLEGHGSLKETKPQAKQALLFRGLHENVYDNIDFVSKYYGLAIPIRNFNKVYKMTFRDANGQSSVQESIGKKFGAEIQDTVVEQYIKELQTPRKKNYTKFDKFKGRWLQATFNLALGSALKQTSSYWTAASILDGNSLNKGLKNFAKSPKQTKAEIDKYSGTLYKRSQGLSTTELGDRANRKRLAGASNKLTKIINEKAPILTKVPQGIRPWNWLQAMDVNTSAALWEACKVEVAKTMKVSDEGYMQAVTDLWERVIEETQSNYDIIHRPESLKDTNVLMQTVTMFTTDIHQKFGVLFSAYNDFATKSESYKSDGSEDNEKAKKEAGKRLSKAVRSIVYSALWMGLMETLRKTILRKFKDLIDDEEKEITSESVAKQYMLSVGEDLFTTIMPINGSVILRAVDTACEGYDFMGVPTFDVMEDFIKAISKVYKAAIDEDGDVFKALYDSAYAIGNATGAPAKNAIDIINAIKGYIGDIKAGEFAHDLEDYTSGNKSFYGYGDLASYIASGNKEKETKWHDYYTANEKEFAKGSLTKELKPVYVQMYLDSPEMANNLKRKLVLDYDYTEADINEWIYDEYLKHIVPDKELADKSISNPEYAIEIRTYAQENNSWQTNKAVKAIQSYYKSAYKKDAEKGNDKQESLALRKALLDDGVVLESALNNWELQVDNTLKKEKAKSEAEKKKFKD